MDIQMQQESSESEGRDIRENLRDLEKEVLGLWYLAQQRGTAVDNVEGTMTATESALSDLVGLIGQMEYELNRSVDKLLELETRQEDLLTERGICIIVKKRNII
ncbi:hypothetical protein SNE40_007326 [Patella caerulea]|uniref:Uncharacterized protein n=1 Tax=Patella caerulea TaxID=87958 RepID=A0AAN8PUU3_PATCE